MVRIFTDFDPFGQRSPLGPRPSVPRALGEAVLIRETCGYPCPDFKLSGGQNGVYGGEDVPDEEEAYLRRRLLWRLPRGPLAGS